MCRPGNPFVVELCQQRVQLPGAGACCRVTLQAPGRVQGQVKQQGHSDKVAGNHPAHWLRLALQFLSC
jgi:hypothetical protein